MKDVAIIAPCHIPVSEEWIIALQSQEVNADIIIVDDSDGKLTFPDTWQVYDYAKQREELGDDLYARFEQFHKSAACKNFGTWLAYKKGYKYIIVIDSDCIIPEDFVAEHLKQLSSTADLWINPLMATGWYSRGFPYSKRRVEIWAHMGLWTKNLDLYGADILASKDVPPSEPIKMYDNLSVSGTQFPLSGMNLAFKREAIPYMLFLPDFDTEEGEHFTRHDDIWGGYIFQKIAYVKNKALSVGKPFVEHDTVVIAQEDADKEKAMIAYEDEFYQFVDNALAYTQELTRKELFQELAEETSIHSVFDNLAPAFEFWAEAFTEYEL